MSSRSLSLDMEYRKTHLKDGLHDFHWMANWELDWISKKTVFWMNSGVSLWFSNIAKFTLMIFVISNVPLDRQFNKNHANHIQGEFSDIPISKKKSRNSHLWFLPTCLVWNRSNRKIAIKSIWRLQIQSWKKVVIEIFEP